jgi:hypothetical protein
MAKIEYYLTIGPLEEVEAIVEYDYQPKERQTYNYPGCDEAIDVCGVTIKGVTLSPEMQSALIDALQDDDRLMDKINEYETYTGG